MLNILLLLLILVSINADNINNKNINEWPIIGLFAQPSRSTDKACGGNCQYIAASYVKYLGLYL